MEEPLNSKRKKGMVEEPQFPRNGGGGIATVSEDILQNILSNLPAISFSFAACVSRTWNRVCKRVLARPKLASALSLNPSLPHAVREVLDKVLSEPIRPHFAIACIGLNFNLDLAHQLITKKLSSKIPIITSVAQGIIGPDAVSNEFREVKWTNASGLEEHNLPRNIHRGITLLIGFVPGLKVEAVPLLRSSEEPRVSMVDKFVMDIRDYAASVSGSTSPEAIVMFGDQHTDMRPVLAKLDYAMSPETAIVGDECGSFLYNNVDPSRFIILNRVVKYFCDGIALVFAREMKKPEDLGETRFHVMLSTGVSPVGSSYKAVSVKEKGKQTECNTWLTARQEGLREVLDGNRILSDIGDELENESEGHELYIGITKRRKCSIGSEKPRVVTSLSFHEVLGGDEEYLFVDGLGIKTGDVFRFYHSDPDFAASSCGIVSGNLANLKQLRDVSENSGKKEVCGSKKEVCGGMVIACYGRGDSFFGHPNVDSSPFLENFPSIPVMGLFCGGEIGRGGSRFIEQEDRETSSLRRYMHVYSTVYLVLSYSPPF